MPRRTKVQIAEDRQTEWRELSTFFEQTTMCEGVCGERKICRRKRRSQPWLCKDCFLGGQGRRQEQEPEPDLPLVDARDPMEVLRERHTAEVGFVVERPSLREAAAVMLAVGAYYEALDRGATRLQEPGFKAALVELGEAIDRLLSVTVPYQGGSNGDVVDHP